MPLRNTTMPSCGLRPMAGAATRSRTGRVLATRAATTWPTGTGCPTTRSAPVRTRSTAGRVAGMPPGSTPGRPRLAARPTAARRRPADRGRGRPRGAPHPRPPDGCRRRRRRDRAHGMCRHGVGSHQRPRERDARRKHPPHHPWTSSQQRGLHPTALSAARPRRGSSRAVVDTLTPARDGGTILRRVSTLTARVLTKRSTGRGATHSPPARPPGPPRTGDPAGRHRGIRHHGDPGRQPGARRASTACPCPARPCATSSPNWSWPGCSRTPTPPPAASPRTPATATTSSRSSSPSRCPPVEQLMIRHQFGQVEFASEHWFRLAATTLAGLTHAAGLATPAKPAAARVRRVDLVAINDRMASLILVLREGTVKQQLVTSTRPHYAGDAHASVAALLNDQLADRTAAADRRAASRGSTAAGDRDAAMSPPRRRARRCARCAISTPTRSRRFQRRAAQRHRRPGVRAQRQAAARLLGPREPRLPRRARRQHRRRPAVSTCSSARRTGRRRCARSSLVLAPYGQPAARSASSVSSGPPACRIRRRSAP